MLLWLAEYLTQYYSAFGVFQYLTLRGILGVLTALLISFIFGPWMISRLNILQVGQVIRDDGPESHLIKAGTPTMGGTLILIAIFVSALLWSDLSNRYVWVVLIVTGIFGAVGFVDDYKKVVEKNIWSYSADMETHTVETHIYRLRKKMIKNFEDHNFIKHDQDGYFIN